MKKGVSSIVGLVLIVAITVLISAIVVTTVSSFFSSSKSVHFVAFSLSKISENEYSISMVGGEIEKIEYCRVYKNIHEIGIFSRNEIGKSISFQAQLGDYLRVVCKFIDESESVVFERLI